MKPFETLDEAEEWMDQNAEGEISVYVEVLNIDRTRRYSIPANGPARVSLDFRSVSNDAEDRDGRTV